MNGSALVNGAVAGGQIPGQGAGQGLDFTSPAGVFDGPAGTTDALEGPAEVGEVGIAIPGLLLADVSWSTASFLPGMTQGLRNLAKGLRQHSGVSSNAYLGISTFADTASNLLPLTRIADPSVTIPELSPRGNGTNFHAALTEALRQFRADLPLLGETADGQKRQIFRPTIYLFTDGQHNTGGDWHPPLAELRTRSWKPNIMVFGWGEADRDVVREIASEGMAYFAADGQTPDAILDQILKVILRSMISATTSAMGQASNPGTPVTTPVIDPQTDPATKGLALIDNSPIGASID
jgi:uncharacterized protein YegL